MWLDARAVVVLAHVQIPLNVTLIVRLNPWYRRD